MKKIIFLSLTLIFVLILSACGEVAQTEAPKAEAPVEEPAVEEVDLGIDCSKYSAEYSKGPSGEDTSPASSVTLTDAEYDQVKAGSYTAALLWAGAGEWYNGLTDGAESEFEKLGITIVATADAQFDPAKQQTDVETALALDPDIILTLVVDPVSGAKAFQPAVDKGVVLVFTDNGADGYVAGNQYVGIVTGNHFGMGRGSADLMAEVLNGKGEIGYIWFDADYFVTNNRDFSFACWLKEKYPDIKIVAKGGFTEEPRTEEVAAAMLVQHPEIDGIYVSWDVAAEGVIAALRSAGRKDIMVVTEDLGATNDLDMAQGGNMYGKTIDLPFQIGETMAKMAAYKLLGKEAPQFVVVDLMKVKKDNLLEAWQEALNMNPPEDVMKALGK